MMFKKTYHVVYLKEEKYGTSTSSNTFTVKGKFKPKELQSKLEEDNEGRNVFLLNWIKL